MSSFFQMPYLETEQDESKIFANGTSVSELGESPEQLLRRKTSIGTLEHCHHSVNS